MIGLSILIFIGVFLILFFRSPVFKISLLVYWFPLLSMVLFCWGIPMEGSLEVISRRYNQAVAYEATWWAVIGFYVLVILLWGVRLKEFSFKRIIIGELSRIILSLVNLCVAAIAFPRAFHLGAERWNLIPGPWAVLFLVLNVIMFLSFNGWLKLSTLLQLLTFLISIAGGERANALLPLMILFVISVQSDNHIGFRKIDFRMSVLLVGVVVLGIFAQVWRKGTGGGVSTLYIFYNLMAPATVQDVVHIYFSSFTYYYDLGLNFRPVINEIGSMLALPVIGGAGLDNEYCFTEILRDYIPNLGGGLFYAEGVLIFGPFGVVIYSILFAMLLRFLFKKHDHYSSAIVLMIVMLEMRFQWYGLIYCYTPIIGSLLVIYLLKKLHYNIQRSNLNSIKRFESSDCT